jgi:sugar phosphate permease
VSTRYRWVVLGLGIAAQAAFAALVQGLPAIGPAIRAEFGFSLSGFGTLLGAVWLGATASLIPWGVATDRLGERLSLSVGLFGTGAALAVGAAGGQALLIVMFVLAGVLGAVANVASGRVVMGWFAFAERGMAFGLRQAAVPLGGALAAATLPALVAATEPRVGVLSLGLGCAVAAVACGLWLREPVVRERPGRGPLRDRRVYRLAAGSALLVALQAAVIGFVVLFLHDERDVSNVAAGAVLAGTQVIGIVLRVVVGRWSDRLGRRVTPLRWTALAIAVAWLVAPALFDAPLALLIPVLVVAGGVAFAWNGLSFNAAAEFAEPGRSGTSIAVQQTALFGTAALISPAFGWLVEATSYQAAFWILAAGPTAAWLTLAPLARQERATPESVPQPGEALG